MSDAQTPPAPEPSFYDEVGGMETFERIVNRFYDGVETDEVLRPMYPEADLADGSARRRFLLFLVQYWGGPNTYSEERGHPRLRMRHAPFTVDETAQEHWLTHFRAALDEVGLTEDQDARLWGYVTYAAQFMRNA
ncbi:globin [Nocardioides marmoribigeumensis]|uniref:Hemoglobin n=1 Tax=Nocardioides marmoribigeumensis TaxID=433649 RepID=A0ABU2C0L1_9ACTN|nr:globin [Nocardioides marmoribigeumensis]MDR7364198.1 hemoglobin [Nocardioides marmoribigeumensis]